MNLSTVKKPLQTSKRHIAVVCEHYNGVRCRACQIMDAMDVLEDEPAVVPDAQRWRKTAEEPPTENDARIRKGHRILSLGKGKTGRKVGFCGRCTGYFSSLDADA
ncbi:MAG: hypothetical protein ACLUVA_07840 [Faecalibacterium sp.]